MTPRRFAPLLLLFAPACALAQDGAPPPAVAPERLRPRDNEALREAAFTPAACRERRRALAAALPEGALIVVANPAEAADYLSYRPDPDFLYLSGRREPELWLALARDVDVLFAPLSDPRTERWSGPRLAPDTPEAAASGFQRVLPTNRRSEVLAELLSAHAGPLFLRGVDLEELGLPDALVEAHTGKVRTPRQAIARLRQVKSPAEVALLQRAIDITAAGLLEAMASVQVGQYEHELQAALEYVFTRYGAQRPGFASIVGSGPNSCVLHYGANTRRLEADEMVVLDVGAELWGYTADVTRTIPSSGRFSPRQREIYELVLRAQAAGFAACKVGNTIMDVDAAARGVIDEAGYGRYFVHSTSHWLGMDVHDVGSMARPLEPGMVLTVEPGIYIAAERIGVRIEDDVLVTAEGPRVLSDGVPRGTAEVEALVRRRGGVGQRDAAPLPARGGAAERDGDGRPGRYFSVSPQGR